MNFSDFLSILIPGCPEGLNQVLDSGNKYLFETKPLPDAEFCWPGVAVITTPCSTGTNISIKGKNDKKEPNDLHYGVLLTSKFLNASATGRDLLARFQSVPAYKACNHLVIHYSYSHGIYDLQSSDRTPDKKQPLVRLSSYAEFTKNSENFKFWEMYSTGIDIECAKELNISEQVCQRIVLLLEKQSSYSICIRNCQHLALDVISGRSFSPSFLTRFTKIATELFSKIALFFPLIYAGCLFVSSFQMESAWLAWILRLILIILIIITYTTDFYQDPIFKKSLLVFCCIAPLTKSLWVICFYSITAIVMAIASFIIRGRPVLSNQTLFKSIIFIVLILFGALASRFAIAIYTANILAISIVILSQIGFGYLAIPDQITPSLWCIIAIICYSCLTENWYQVTLYSIHQSLEFSFSITLKCETFQDEHKKSLKSD